MGSGWFSLSTAKSAEVNRPWFSREPKAYTGLSLCMTPSEKSTRGKKPARACSTPDAAAAA